MYNTVLKFFKFDFYVILLLSNKSYGSGSVICLFE